MNYRELYEKHARSYRIHAYAGIITGVLSIAVGILKLKQLQDEKKG